MDLNLGTTAPVPHTRRNGWLSWTPKNTKVGMKRMRKVGTKKIRGVHIRATKDPMETQQNGDGEPPRPSEEDKTQKEDGNNNLRLGEVGEQLKLDEKGKTQQEGNGDLALGKDTELSGADEVDKSQAVDKDEGGRCLTDVSCGGTRPPRNLMEAINILAGEPSRAFAHMDVLDILKMKGIDLTPPQSKRHKDGAR